VKDLLFQIRVWWELRKHLKMLRRGAKLAAPILERLWREKYREEYERLTKQ